MRGVITCFLIFISCWMQAQEYQLSMPLMKIEGGQFFEKNTSVHIEFRLKGARIHYTLNGNEPTPSSPRYRGPIKIKWSRTIKVKAFKEGFIPSETVVQRVFRVNGRPASIELSPKPKPPYDARMSETLTNLKAGSFNFHDGEWIGYNKGPIIIDVDLGRPRMKTAVTLCTLTSPGSWIMNPDKIIVERSNDGENWEESMDMKITPVKAGDSAKKQYYEVHIGRAFRYVRFTIHPMASLPNWHPGKGQPAWVFLDEIIVK